MTNSGERPSGVAAKSVAPPPRPSSPRRTAASQDQEHTPSPRARRHRRRLSRASSMCRSEGRAPSDSAEPSQAVGGASGSAGRTPSPSSSSASRGASDTPSPTATSGFGTSPAAYHLSLTQRRGQGVQSTDAARRLVPQALGARKSGGQASSLPAGTIGGAATATSGKGKGSAGSSVDVAADVAKRRAPASTTPAPAGASRPRLMGLAQLKHGLKAATRLNHPAPPTKKALPASEARAQSTGYRKPLSCASCSLGSHALVHLV